MFRERQQKKEDYDHELEKENTRLRVAAIRARRPKCPLGRECKDLSCILHPDRGRIRQKPNSAEVKRSRASLLDLLAGEGTRWRAVTNTRDVSLTN